MIKLLSILILFVFPEAQTKSNRFLIRAHSSSSDGDKEILSSCSNAKLFPYGTTWIKDFEFPEQKEYCITTLIGGKTQCSGHVLRHSVPEKSKSITSIPVHLYNSINTKITLKT